METKYVVLAADNIDSFASAAYGPYDDPDSATADLLNAAIDYVQQDYNPFLHGEYDPKDIRLIQYTDNGKHIYGCKCGNRFITFSIVPLGKPGKEAEKECS